jgi:hypothetical protein
VNSILPAFFVIRILLYLAVGAGIAARLFKFEDVSPYLSWDFTRTVISTLFVIEAGYWNLKYHQLKEQMK